MGETISVEAVTSSSTDSELSSAIQQLPYLVIELTADGAVAGANPRLERLTGAPVVERPFSDFLDDESAGIFRAALVDRGGAAEARPLTLKITTAAGTESRAFHLVREAGVAGRAWLFEDPLVEERHDVAAEDVVVMQRELAKKTARLASALDEIERSLNDNERLWQQLQERNEQVEVQSGELLSITRELHEGQGELLQLHQRLERRSRELQVAVSGRTRFYASMSHELRTPVNAVMGYNDLLLAGVYGDLNEQQEMAVERSQKAVRQLRELINDVLDLSRIESGKIEVEVEEVPLGELLEDLLATVQPLSDAQQTRVHLSLEGAPASVRTDPRRLRQILLHLLSNAIKYGDGSPVWVRIEGLAEGGTLLEVVDNGPGIAPEHLDSIFEEFTQYYGGAHVGTGLGLAIARRLARILGGDIEASSTLGVGTTFRLKLPSVPILGVADAR